MRGSFIVQVAELLEKDGHFAGNDEKTVLPPLTGRGDRRKSLRDKTPPKTPSKSRTPSSSPRR